jgi:hypothetical protein
LLNAGHAFWRISRGGVAALIHQAIENPKSTDVQAIKSLLQGIALGVIGR